MLQKRRRFLKKWLPVILLMAFAVVYVTLMLWPDQHAHPTSRLGPLTPPLSDEHDPNALPLEDDVIHPDDLPSDS